LQSLYQFKKYPSGWWIAIFDLKLVMKVNGFGGESGQYFMIGIFLNRISGLYLRE